MRFSWLLSFLYITQSNESKWRKSSRAKITMSSVVRAMKEKIPTMMKEKVFVFGKRLEGKVFESCFLNFHTIFFWLFIYRICQLGIKVRIMIMNRTCFGIKFHAIHKMYIFIEPSLTLLMNFTLPCSNKYVSNCQRSIIQLSMICTWHLSTECLSTYFLNNY